MNRLRRVPIALLILATGLTTTLPAQTGDSKSAAIDPEAMGSLNKMGAYLRSLKSFQVTADTTSDVVLEDGQKIEHATKVNIVARPPDRLIADLEGDLLSRMYLYNGKEFTIFARRAGIYSTLKAPPTLGELIDVMDEYDIDFPLVDVFLFGGPRAGTSEITAADLVGDSVIGGVACSHYIFRQPGLDWQIWIQKGEYPLPRRLVLTSTTDESRPQYSSVLHWNLAPSFNEPAFTFVPPPGVGKAPITTAAAAAALKGSK